MIAKEIFIITFLIYLTQSLRPEGRYQISGDGVVHFDGYTLFRMVPKNDAELKFLQSLTYGEENQLDFWKAPSRVNDAVDVMVPPDKVIYLEQLLIANKIPRTIVMHDVERYIQKEKLEFASPNAFASKDEDSFFNNYRNLNEIHKHLDDIANENKKNAITMSVGKSSENNDLKLIKIGNTSPNSTKPSIWIDGGIHAREWISQAVVTYVATKLVEDYNKDPEVKELVDTFDWYILPVVNPDGYEYSRTTNRMWRKSRRWSKSSLWGCTGVDLNRNFGYHWREGGSSTNPCKDDFAGTAAFSEPETKAISNFILQRKNTMKSYLAVHSYSQLWLTPWGWTKKLPKDYSSMIAVAKEATQALTELYGTGYRIGSSTNVLYVATGGADDWAHGVAGIKYSYTLELRDNGVYGFLLPPEQIIPTGQETFAGIKAMAKAIKREL